MDINIKALENLTDAAKNFLQKVVTPPLEEVGLLFADKVKLWRFKNQISILTKAEEYLKAKNIKTRTVSIKMLTPLLEGAALEDNENLQEKWACLFSNIVQENSKINTTLYMHLLSQISSNEAKLFDAIFTLVTLEKEITGFDEVVMEYVTLTIEEINRARPELDFNEEEIDNLIRLRLIKDELHENPMTSTFSLTQLGFKFYLACQSE